MVILATDADFRQYLEKNDKVVVKFFAGWCGTCRLFDPKYKKMAEREDFKNVLFLDINAEDNPVARKLAGVSNLPFFAVFKNGQLVAADTTAKEEGVEALIQKINN
jgi:thioredoxin 1